MTQPPPPPNQPPQQGGYGPPQDQRPEQPSQTPPPPGGPDLAKPAQPPAPGYGHAQATQPPQGAPQTPPPPAQPPSGPPQPQPGYGYPQAPQSPQQPQQPVGYGYPGGPGTPAPTPAPAPNPYATPQPGQYATSQPGYGYPGPPGYPGQQPTVPGQAQAGGPDREKKKQLMIIVAAVVAIALIIGGGVVYSKSSGDGGGKQDTAGTSGGTGGKDGDKGGGTSTRGDEKVPADTAAKVLFQLPMPKVDDTTTVSGSWLTDKVYAKSGVAQIVGYDPGKGTRLWTLKLPGPVCQVTRRVTADHKTVVAYEPAMPTKDKPYNGCTQVSAIDLDAGKKLWTRTVKIGDQPVRLDNVTISGGTAALGSTSGGAAFDLATGKALWTPKPGDSCYDAGYGGGEKLVAVRKCGTYDHPQLRIQTIDPKSGKVISEYKMATGIEYASVVSTNPLVVAAEVGDSDKSHGVSDLFSIDNRTGALRNRISVPGDRYAARCDGITRIEACTGIVIGNDHAYLATAEHDGSSGSFRDTNEIVAFDLGTGKQTGQRADAGDGYTITPLRMDGGNILAYKEPPYDKGGQIVSIDGASFKETKLLENPADKAVRDAETTFSTDYAEILYHDGRLFMSQVYASDFSSSSDRYLAIAFGTG
ncbi:outer membrane protein assembly factor BamB family protein [Streptomyces sp. NPDC003393]